MPGNVEKTRTAPVVAIVAYDSRFYEEMPRIWHNPAARDMFGGNAELAASTAFRNGSLQGGYLMMVARGLGLDCGPMSGFVADKVDTEFFPDGRWKTNFLCGLGHGDPAKLMARQPRLPFEDACRVL
jgi:3-hydroxypropanoate dehydrogenase